MSGALQQALRGSRWAMPWVAVGLISGVVLFGLAWLLSSTTHRAASPVGMIVFGFPTFLLAAFLFLAFTFASWIEWRRTRRFSKGALGFIGLSFWLVLCLVGSRMLYGGHSVLPTGSHELTFDEHGWADESWEQDRTVRITPRQRMLGDVVEYVLPGRTEDEIVALLGPGRPPHLDEDDGSVDLAYRMGPQRDTRFFPDVEWLLIWFDKAGLFERYKVAVGY